VTGRTLHGRTDGQARTTRRRPVLALLIIIITVAAAGSQGRFDSPRLAQQLGTEDLRGRRAREPAAR
jgi:hypothetical protein